MSKERVISLLGTAKTMESPEDMRSLIAKALILLRSEPDIVPALGIVQDMIWDALQKLNKNRPRVADSPEERAEKIAICESALLQIKEYASEGLKARAQGSLDVAEELLKGRENHSLGDYEDSKVIITGSDGKSVETTAGKFNEVCEAVQRDPSIVDRVLQEGDQ